MDTWDLETLLVMSELGNSIVNNIYEAQASNEIRKPNAETDAYDEGNSLNKLKRIFYFRISRRSYIEAKYVQKLFLRPLPNSGPIRSSTRTIRRWSIVKTSLSSLNIGNENDDDLSHSSRNNNRRIEFLNKITPSPSDPDLTIGNRSK